MTNRTTAIAHKLAEQARGERHPYNYLRYLAEHIYDGEVWDSYFAAVNILKAEGVENAKPKPLTKMTEKERKAVRATAKKLAGLMQKCLGLPVVVERRPLRTYPDGVTNLMMSVATKPYWKVFLYPTVDELNEFAKLTPDKQVLKAYALVQRYKSSDERIDDRIEVIKADLESLLTP